MFPKAFQYITQQGAATHLVWSCASLINILCEGKLANERQVYIQFAVPFCKTWRIDFSLEKGAVVALAFTGKTYILYLKMDLSCTLYYAWRVVKMVDRSMRTAKLDTGKKFQQVAIFVSELLFLITIWWFWLFKFQNLIKCRV